MSDCIIKFFEAWQIEEAEPRTTKIKSAVTEDVQYNDPRTPESIMGIEDLSNYVGMFSANAPGWTAKVVKSDTIANTTRVTVVFGGIGPDGSKQTQYGQYFVEQSDGLVSKMIGFVGTGEID